MAPHWSGPFYKGPTLVVAHYSKVQSALL